MTDVDRTYDLKHPKRPPPVPITSPEGDYLVIPDPGATSITLREFVDLLTEHSDTVDWDRPLRALGRFDSRSTLGVMFSPDGSVAVMGVD